MDLVNSVFLKTYQFVTFSFFQMLLAAQSPTLGHYLAAQSPTLGHYRGENLTQPILITVF